MSHGGLMMMMMEVVVVPHFEGAAHSAICRAALARVVASSGSVGRPTTALCVGGGCISLQYAAHQRAALAELAGRPRHPCNSGTSCVVRAADDAAVAK